MFQIEQSAVELMTI